MCKYMYSTLLTGFPNPLFQENFEACLQLVVHLNTPYVRPSIVPRPPHPAFVACSTKSGRKAWMDLSRDVCPGGCHVQSAHSRVCSLLSLFFPKIQFVLSVQFVLWVRLLLDRSWLATVRDVSHSIHYVISPSRPSPAFRTASDKSWAWRPGNEAMSAGFMFHTLHTVILTTHSH